MGQAQSIDDTLLDMKLQSKTLARQAEKYAKKSKQQKAKIKAMLAKGDLASARIYGENAIQAQAQYKNLLGLSSKLDGVASRIQSAQATKNMQPLMKKTVQGIASVLKQTDMVKLSKTMDAFEEQFGEVDNVTTLMSQAVAEATANSTPVDSVEALMKQVAEENGLEVAAQLEGAGAVPTGMVQEKAPAQVDADADKADELQARLAKLRTAA